MVERLAEDHRMARRLAEGLAESGGVEVDPARVETNIVMCRLTGGADACSRLTGRLKERGVLISQLTADTVRLVTHRHIGPEQVDTALAAVREALR